MDYVTRQFIILTKKFRKELPKLAELVRHDLKQHSKAAHAAKKRSEEQQDIQPVWLEPVIAKYQEPVEDKKATDNRHYRAQNSIRWATWCAFIAASVYAGIAVLQWRQMIAATNFAEIGAVGTVQASYAARQSVDAAQQSLRDIQDNFRKQLRPLYGSPESSRKGRLTTVLISISTWRNLIGLFILRITGCLRLSISELINILAIGENAIRQVRWYEIPVKKGGGILAPTEVNFDTAFSEQALNPERQAALAKINGGYVVFGHFEYSDISEPDGSPYVSQFCFYHLSNNANDPMSSRRAAATPPL